MSNNTQENAELPAWAKKVLVSIAIAAVCFWIGYRDSQQRLDPNVKAVLQLARDFDAVSLMPEHRQVGQYFEALDRANKAAPELADALLESENEETRQMGQLLLMVKNNPNLADPKLHDQLSEMVKDRRGLPSRKWGNAFK